MKRNKRRKQAIDQKARTLIAHHNSKSPISEQYRTIRTNIEFSTIDQELKTIMVTSTSPGEGKTTTASNLAVVMAQQGKRVLLIDADLRKPAIHYTFRLTNTQGLTSVLSKHIQLEEGIHKTEVPNLDVLPSGPIPPNPTEMVGSAAMAYLLKELSTYYEMIIIDSPPTLAVADSQVMANRVDGTVLVVQSGGTDKEAALKAKEQLIKAKAKLLGVVLNRKEVKGSSYYYYYANK